MSARWAVWFDPDQRTEISDARRPLRLTNENIGGTDVDDGNAGEPNLYRAGCRDGRSVAGAVGVALTPSGGVEQVAVPMIDGGDDVGLGEFTGLSDAAPERAPGVPRRSSGPSATAPARA
jgi:hypothetical protein